MAKKLVTADWVFLVIAKPLILAILEAYIASCPRVHHLTLLKLKRVAEDDLLSRGDFQKVVLALAGFVKKQGLELLSKDFGRGLQLSLLVRFIQRGGMDELEILGIAQAGKVSAPPRIISPPVGNLVPLRAGQVNEKTVFYRSRLRRMMEKYFLRPVRSLLLRWI